MCGPLLEPGTGKTKQNKGKKTYKENFGDVEGKKICFPFTHYFRFPGWKIILTKDRLTREKQKFINLCIAYTHVSTQ